jgi:hypothetical protein
MGELKSDEIPPKVDLAEERRKRETAPKAKRGRPPGAQPKPGLENRLKDFYSTLVGAMYFVDSDVAAFQEQHITRLAATQAAWAKENAHVRRFLETMVTGGIGAAAIGEAVVVVGGSVMIVQAKRGALDSRYFPAAQFFGIDLPPPPPAEYPENGDRNVAEN